MKTIKIVKKGKPEKLKLEASPIPIPGENDVLIKVVAAGVNFADILARQGLYPEAPKVPFIPGYEVAGIIEDTREKITRFKKGDRVVALTNFGGYAEFVSTPSILARHLPEDKSFEEAAGLPVNFTTAYHSLYNTGSFTKGNRVLIQAAAGGVGLAAVQLCKIMECEIFGTASSIEKITFLKNIGVHHPINYFTCDFEEEILKITKNEKLDIILDSIGGKFIAKELRLLRGHGRIVNLGIASISGKGKLKILIELLKSKRVHPIKLLTSSKGFYGVNIRKIWEFRPDLGKVTFDNIMKLYTKGKIKPIISRVFSLEEAAKAHSFMENRKNIGKIILKV